MIKKKLAIALIAVAIVGVFSSGVIYAYFNDTETSAGNSFTAGTLDLTVNTQDPWTGATFTATALKPGSTGTSIMHLSNTGTIDGTLVGKISNIVNAPGSTPEPEPTPDAGELAGVMQVTVWIDANNNGVMDETAIYSGLLSGATADWTLGALSSGATTHVGITYLIPTGAGNNIMGDICTFSIDYTLTQA